jgi:hypothetical protein
MELINSKEWGYIRTENINDKLKVGIISKEQYREKII